MPIFSHKRGFTLIETIIYVGLLGLLLTGLFTSILPLITGAERITADVAAEGEAAFVLRKIEWALSTMITSEDDDITAPSAGGAPGNTLTINPSGSIPTVSFSWTSGTGIVTYTDDSGTYDLNAGRVKIENFSVTHTELGGESVHRAIQVEFDIDGKHVGPVEYHVKF